MQILTAANWELFQIVSPVFCLFLKYFWLLFELDKAYIPFKHKINTKNKTNTVCFYGEIPFQRVFIFIQNFFFNSSNFSPTYWYSPCVPSTQIKNSSNLNNSHRRAPAAKNPATMTTTHPATTNQIPQSTKEPIRRSRRIQQQNEQRARKLKIPCKYINIILMKARRTESKAQ